jgi:hypothetical protein
MIRLSLYLMVALLSLDGCKAMQMDQDQEQGIIGQLYWMEGNQMPMIVEDEEEPIKQEKNKIQRTVRIYELTRLNQLEQSNGLFAAPPTTLVAEVTSDETGHFKVGLPPGKYSVFTVEEDGLFASIFDREMNVNPVEITEEEWVIMNIKIDYKAFY